MSSLRRSAEFGSSGQNRTPEEVVMEPWRAIHQKITLSMPDTIPHPAVPHLRATKGRCLRRGGGYGGHFGRGRRHLALYSSWFVFARPAPAPPPSRPNPAWAVLVASSTAVFPATAAVQGAQSDRPCLFASDEASDTERLRRSPQIRPQPTHPAHQDTAWHREVNGDIAVAPAVYNPAV